MYSGGHRVESVLHDPKGDCFYTASWSGVAQDGGTIRYATSGWPSRFRANVALYEMRLADGWRPPQLRQRWWQLWRPDEYEPALWAALTASGVLYGE